MFRKYKTGKSGQTNNVIPLNGNPINTNHSTQSKLIQQDTNHMLSTSSANRSNTIISSNNNQQIGNNKGADNRLHNAIIGADKTCTQLQFHCQLAHGSPTVFLTGFSNVRELYQKIGESFDLPPSEILFCTLNTYKIDMKKLLGGQIGLEDFIFAHRKGRPKEIELEKTEDALGLTITDNGAGYAFIKRIKEGSIIDRIPHIQVGDHIERLNGDQMIGKRHFEVAKVLKDISRGEQFSIRLVEPLQSGFTIIAPKNSTQNRPHPGVVKTGRETLRFKVGGSAIITTDRDDLLDVGCDKINAILEAFLGINDAELAGHIWELATGTKNSMELAERIDGSDLEVFGFSDELVIELWGAITDARQGR